MKWLSTVGAATCISLFCLLALWQPDVAADGPAHNLLSPLSWTLLIAALAFGIAGCSEQARRRREIEARIIDGGADSLESLVDYHRTLNNLSPTPTRKATLISLRQKILEIAAGLQDNAGLVLPIQVQRDLIELLPYVVVEQQDIVMTVLARAGTPHSAGAFRTVRAKLKLWTSMGWKADPVDFDRRAEMCLAQIRQRAEKDAFADQLLRTSDSYDRLLRPADKLSPSRDVGMLLRSSGEPEQSDAAAIATGVEDQGHCERNIR